MTQFIELETSYGVLTRGQRRGNSLRYFSRREAADDHAVVLMGGTEYEIRQDVAEIDARIRNEDKKAIFSQA